MGHLAWNIQHCRTRQAFRMTFAFTQSRCFHLRCGVTVITATTTAHASMENTTMKTALITGCSAGGIGSALAECFNRRGVYVFATARTLSKMEHLQSLPHITLLELDVTSASSIAAALECVTAKTGGTLDYLVNNSGQSMVMPVLDSNLDEAKKMFDVNLWGASAMTQAFAPLVLASKGSIVNICSISGCLNAPWMGFYGASKAALMLASETLRLEMAPFGVKVVSVVTGAIDTNIMTNTCSSCQLPLNSVFKGAFKEIKERARGEDVQSKTNPKEFADKVVGDIFGGASGRIWRGTMASAVRWVSTFMPAWMIDKAMVEGTGLDKLP